MIEFVHPKKYLEDWEIHLMLVDGEPVSMMLTQPPGRMDMLWSVWVHPDHRGNGYVHTMLEHIYESPEHADRHYATTGALYHSHAVLAAMKGYEILPGTRLDKDPASDPVIQARWTDLFNQAVQIWEEESA